MEIIELILSTFFLGAGIIIPIKNSTNFKILERYPTFNYISTTVIKYFGLCFLIYFIGYRSYILFNLDEKVDLNQVINFMFGENFTNIFVVFLPYVILPQLFWITSVRQSKFYTSLIVITTNILSSVWFSMFIIQVIFFERKEMGMLALMHYNSIYVYLSWLFSLFFFLLVVFIASKIIKVKNGND